MGIRRKKYLIDEIKALGKYSCVGGPFGSSLTQAHYVDFKAVPVIRGANLTNDEFQDAGFVYVSEEKGNELNKNMAFPGDIVFTQRGTLGQVALIPTNAKFSRYVVSQSQMKLTVNPDIADAYFIYSYFRSKNTKKHIESNAIVGGVPHINLGILKNIAIELPPLEAQKKIVGVLRGLDDKITLNRQINQTLEQMAQTLFKSWFVDFDPVIDNALDAGNEIPESLQARAELRQKVRASQDFQPLPADIRALFPAEFEESELGWVPKGWRETELSTQFKLNGGHPFKSETYTDDGLFGVVTIKNVQDGIFVDDCSNRINKLPTNMKMHCLLAEGDVLMSLTGNVARVCLVSSGKFLLNQRVARIDAVDNIPRCFSYFYFRQKYIFDKLLSIAKGTAQLNLSPIEAMQVTHCLPSNETIKLLSKVFETYYAKLISCKKDIQILIALRDTILPKLISGELRLDDLPDEVVAAANE